MAQNSKQCKEVPRKVMVPNKRLVKGCLWCWVLNNFFFFNNSLLSPISLTGQKLFPLLSDERVSNLITNLFGQPSSTLSLVVYRKFERQEPEASLCFSPRFHQLLAFDTSALPIFYSTLFTSTTFTLYHYFYLFVVICFG